VLAETAPLPPQNGVGVTITRECLHLAQTLASPTQKRRSVVRSFGRDEPQEVKQEGDHRAGIFSGSRATDQPLARRPEFWRRTGWPGLFEEFLRAVPVQIHRPTPHDRERARDLADAKDVSILAAAIGAGARILVTHNIRHFRSGEGVRVVRPGTLIEEARAWMGSFGT